MLKLYDGTTHERMIQETVRSPRLHLDKPVIGMYVENNETPLTILNGDYKLAKGGTPQSACIYGKDVSDLSIIGGIFERASRCINIRGGKNVLVKGVECRDSSVETLIANYINNLRLEKCKTRFSSNNGIDFGFNVVSRIIDCDVADVTGYLGEAFHYDSTIDAVVKGGTVKRCLNAAHAIHQARRVDLSGQTIEDTNLSGRGDAAINIIGKPSKHSQTIYVHDMILDKLHGALAGYINGATAEDVWWWNVKDRAGKTLSPKVVNKHHTIHINEGKPKDYKEPDT